MDMHGKPSQQGKRSNTAGAWIAGICVIVFIGIVLAANQQSTTASQPNTAQQAANQQQEVQNCEANSQVIQLYNQELQQEQEAPLALSGSLAPSLAVLAQEAQKAQTDCILQYESN